MTLTEIRDRKLIVLDCISGSRAYGLDGPGSDTDLRGVFVLPQDDYYGLHYTEQVSSERNDEVYYELGRFFELLLRNNPNIIELLGTPEAFVRHRHPLMETLRPELFLSRLCRDTFANYALSQIRKARGLNKKINKPMTAERRTVEDFCYVTQEGGSIPFGEWLAQEGCLQEDCGLAAVPHMRDLYGLFINLGGARGYRGVFSGPDANDVSLSSIPKGERPRAYLHFNRDAYSIYCKEYKSYREWVRHRNEARYEGTILHGKSYDAKNMMHVFRLLRMAREIGTGEGIQTFRNDRAYLLQVKNGAFDYDELMAEADAEMARIENIYAHTTLSQTPDREAAEALLVRLRHGFYAEGIGSR